jgi:hypothetical protein
MNMGALHITGLFTLRRSSGSGYVLARSFRYASFPRQNSATFLQPWVLLRKPLFGLQKRRKQPERYTPFAQKMYKK